MGLVDQDISPFSSLTSSQESRDAVIPAVRSACHEYGFFQLSGHGVPVTMQQEILLYAKRLFDLPLGQKQAMAVNKSMGVSRRGYEAAGAQK